MKPVMCVLLFFSLVFSSCKKEMVTDPIDINESLPPDGLTSRFPPIPRPRPALPLAICISSYQDILNVLGSDDVTVRAVVLESGLTVTTGGDINSIHYTVADKKQGYSLFNSDLLVEWRFPAGNWQLSTQDVWSLGCVYTSAGQPPYTNLIRGIDTILINTVFYWSAWPYAGQRVEWVVLE